MWIKLWSATIVDCLGYMGIVLAVFPLICGYIIVQAELANCHCIIWGGPFVASKI